MTRISILIILFVSCMVLNVYGFPHKNTYSVKFAQRQLSKSQNFVEKNNHILNEQRQLTNEIRNTEVAPIIPIPLTNECQQDDEPYFWYSTGFGRLGMFGILGGTARTSYGGILNLYIVRAKVNNTLIPGKLIEGDGVARVGVNGSEMQISRYEISSSHRFHTTVWVDYDGTLPQNVIPGGTGAGGNTIYIGRASSPWMAGNRTFINIEVGAFYPQLNQLVITVRGKVVIVKENFQLLARTSNLECE